MRVVIDANVYISALISSKGAPARLIEHWLQGKFEPNRSEYPSVRPGYSSGYCC